MSSEGSDKCCLSNCENIDTRNAENLRDSKKTVCNVEGSSCFSGYGSQSGNQHPFYRTTSREYGWFAPDNHTAPIVYYPTKQKFSSHLAAAGMYRNYSLNTSLDPPQYK